MSTLMEAAPPVVPALLGTHRFNINIDAELTIGRDYVKDAALNLLRSTRIISCDIETYGVGKDARRLKSVSFGNANSAVILDPRDDVQAELCKLIFNASEILVFHNAPFDVPNLYLNGLMTMDQIDKVIDTIVYARLADPDDIGDRGLLNSGSQYCGLDGEDHLTKAFKMMGLSRADGYRVFDLDRAIYVQGAAADVVITARLLPVIRHAAYLRTTHGHPFSDHGVSSDEAYRLVDREQRVNRWALKQSCKGLAVDFEYLDTYKAQTMEVRSKAEAKLESLGIRPGVSADLTKWLEDNNQLPEGYPRTPKTKAPSGEAKHLETVDNEVARLFVSQKKIVKILDDYLQKIVDLSVNGRIHPRSDILKAATGRMSMSDPPLQQFSGPARGIIVADQGRELGSCDWSAIEPVIISNIAGEEGAIAHYEAGGDFYQGLADLAGVPRKTAKVILLAGLYGEGIKKLAADLKKTEDEAKSLQNHIFGTMPKVADVLQTLRQTARRYKMIVTTSGRIVPVPEGFYDGQKSVQAHKGCNYFVQGSAWDVMAETVIRAIDAGIADHIYLLMHDELVFDWEINEEVQRVMQTPPERLCFMAGRTPILRTDCVNMGRHWQSV